MTGSSFINEYLSTYFDELNYKEFYRAIFPIGTLEPKGASGSTGLYNALALEIIPQEDKAKVKKYIITDELEQLDELVTHDNFIIISPISYVGRSRAAENARYIYALAIDLDGIETKQNIKDLFYQISNDILPKPTYTVSSGSGLHLYYQFEKPIPCYKNIARQLTELKNALTRKIWNKYVTVLYEQPQYQSLFQGFRIVGGITKQGGKVRVFESGKPIDIEYLNGFVEEGSRVTDYSYKSSLTLAEAKIKYPLWYEKRIEQQQPKGYWICKDDLYKWWLNRLKNEITVGHRYYSILVLAIYAKKCNITREQLEQDAFSLVPQLEQLTEQDNNHFTAADVLAALEMYNDNYFTFPIESIEKLTALKIKRNKRNGRKQKTHLAIARATLQILNEENGKALQGRPTKESIVTEWRQQHPNGTKAQCIRETGISKPTVYKHWKT